MTSAIRTPASYLINFLTVSLRFFPLTIMDITIHPFSSIKLMFTETLTGKRIIALDFSPTKVNLVLIHNLTKISWFGSICYSQKEDGCFRCSMTIRGRQP